jgi:hypothetical protein
MDENEYWVTVKEEEASHFNSRADRKLLKSGMIKVWYGNGLPGQTSKEDRQGIRRELSMHNISPVRITTK